MRMKTSYPARKVTAATLGAAAAAVVNWLIETFLTGEPLPAGVRDSLVVIAVFVIGYLTPPSDRDGIESGDGTAT